MKRPLIMALVSIFAVFIISLGLAYIVKDYGAGTQITLALSAMAALFSLVAVPFFLSGARQFKTELQHAYLILCIGFGAFGLAQLQLPIVSFFNWYAWLDSGGVALLYVFGVAGIYWGIRSIALLLRITTVWLSPIVTLVAALTLSFGSAFLPHIAIQGDELPYDLSLGLGVWNTIVITAATITAFLVRQKIGVIYTRSMNWLCAALAVLSFAGWHYAFIQLIMTTGTWYYDYSVVLIPFAVGALLLVIASYAFNTIDVLETKTTPSGTPTQTDNDTELQLNIITYTASLTSNPADIDVILDGLRHITSTLEPGQTLSPAEHAALVTIYQQLEDYLVHNDPLRTFTQDEIRQDITKKFRLEHSPWIPFWTTE